MKERDYRFAKSEEQVKKINALLAYGFNSYYMRVLAVVPFIGGVLFFDTRFSVIASIAITIENFSSGYDVCNLVCK